MSAKTYITKYFRFIFYYQANKHFFTIFSIKYDPESSSMLVSVYQHYDLPLNNSFIFLNLCRLSYLNLCNPKVLLYDPLDTLMQQQIVNHLFVQIASSISKPSNVLGNFSYSVVRDLLSTRT